MPSGVPAREVGTLGFVPLPVALPGPASPPPARCLIAGGTLGLSLTGLQLSGLLPLVGPRRLLGGIEIAVRCRLIDPFVSLRVAPAIAGDERPNTDGDDD